MDITSFLQKAADLVLNPLIYLAFAISFVYFFYGVIQFLRQEASDTNKTREEARDAILWGLVGMAIMFSVYGLIGFVLDTFGVSKTGPGASYILNGQQ